MILCNNNNNNLAVCHFLGELALQFFPER